MKLVPLVAFLLLSLTSLAEPDVQGIPTFDYPIKFGYINSLSSWSSATAIATSLGVPGYSTHNFNFIALTFWTCINGPLDTAILWNNPVQYMGATTEFGMTNEEIRANLKAKYHSKGIKLVVSAFGAT